MELYNFTIKSKKKTMKKLLPLILIAVCMTFNSFGQINVVETEKSEETVLIGKIGGIGETWIECTKTGNTYTFKYKDMKFEQVVDYKSFSFDDIDGAFDAIYNMMNDGIDNPPEEDVIIELPESFIFLHFGRTRGQSYVEIRHAVTKNTDVFGVTTWMNKKKLKKVFGKK